MTVAWKKMEAAMMWLHARTFTTMVTHLHSVVTVVSYYSNTTVVILPCSKSGLAVFKLGSSVCRVSFKKI